MVGKCYKVGESDRIVYAHSAAVVANTPIYVAGIGVLIPVASADANVLAAYYRSGVFAFPVANSVAVTIGALLFYDSSAGNVVLTKPTEGFLIGTALSAGTGDSAGSIFVEVDINFVEVDINKIDAGNGNFHASDLYAGLMVEQKSVAAVADSAVTLTAAQVKGGLVTQTPTENRTITLPAAADLLALIPNAKVGSYVPLTVKNLAAATYTCTVTASESITNGGVAGDFVIAASGTATYDIVFSNVTAGSVAAVVYKR
jgi:hypothetical protein